MSRPYYNKSNADIAVEWAQQAYVNRGTDTALILDPKMLRIKRSSIRTILTNGMAFAIDKCRIEEEKATLRNLRSHTRLRDLPDGRCELFWEEDRATIMTRNIIKVSAQMMAMGSSAGVDTVSADTHEITSTVNKREALLTIERETPVTEKAKPKRTSQHTSADKSKVEKFIDNNPIKDSTTEILNELGMFIETAKVGESKESFGRINDDGKLTLKEMFDGNESYEYVVKSDSVIVRRVK